MIVCLPSVEPTQRVRFARFLSLFYWRLCICFISICICCGVSAGSPADAAENEAADAADAADGDGANEKAVVAFDDEDDDDDGVDDTGSGDAGADLLGEAATMSTGISAAPLNEAAAIAESNERGVIGVAARLAPCANEGKGISQIRRSGRDRAADDESIEQHCAFNHFAWTNSNMALIPDPNLVCSDTSECCKHLQMFWCCYRAHTCCVLSSSS